MTWVKRAGGAGTGGYQQGLAGVIEGRGTPRASRLDRHVELTDATATGREEPTAYHPTYWADVRENRTILDVLSHWVRSGNHAVDSMLYEDALAVFGPTSAHLAGACRGEQGAGAHYQATVASGRYRDGE